MNLSFLTITPPEITTPLETTASSLDFNPQNFINYLAYMGKGMLGIFVVIGIIVSATYVLNKIFSGKK